MEDVGQHLRCELVPILVQEGPPLVSFGVAPMEVEEDDTTLVQKDSAMAVKEDGTTVCNVVVSHVEAAV